MLLKVFSSRGCIHSLGNLFQSSIFSYVRLDPLQFLALSVVLPSPIIHHNKAPDSQKQKMLHGQKKIWDAFIFILAKRVKDIFCFLAVYIHFEISFSGLRSHYSHVQTKLLHKSRSFKKSLYFFFCSSQKRNCRLPMARKAKS